MLSKTAFVLAAAVGFSVSQTAFAADLPVKAPAVKASYSWSGFYIGGNVGYGWVSGSDPGLSLVDGSGSGITAYFNAGGFPVTAVNPKGAFGGGQIGYNWQSNALVLGVVADIQAASMDASNTVVAAPPLFITGTTTLNRKIDWFGTVRGKLGWAMQNWLVYGTGGFAYGRIDETLTFASSGVPTGSASTGQSKTGWTVGGGFEYGVNRWSFGVEYLYIDLGGTDITMPFSGYVGANLDSITVSSSNTINVVRALANYRF